jgi:hypothetical protein
MKEYEDLTDEELDALESVIAHCFPEVDSRG